MNENFQSSGCCPPFNPAPWDDAIVEWHGKPFVKGRVFTFLYIPINFGSVISRLMKKVGAAGAGTPDGLCLSDHTSRWNMDLYLAVDHEVPGLANTTISGSFLSKVYEGNFKETGTWCRDFNELAASRQLKVSKLYLWYTTCPRCAKKFGKNYVVILGKLE